MIFQKILQKFKKKSYTSTREWWYYCWRLARVYKGDVNFLFDLSDLIKDKRGTILYEAFWHFSWKQFIERFQKSYYQDKSWKIGPVLYHETYSREFK